MMRILGRKLGTVTVAALAASMLAACGSTGADGSRAYIYQSLEELVGDSAVVVVGTVRERSEVRIADISQTRLTFDVEEQFFPAGLGKRPTVEGLSTHATHKVPLEIQVRQPGAIDAGPAPTLDAKTRYLLFLVPAVIDGQFVGYYVTGGVAGMYVSDGDQFRRVSKDEDKIPATLKTSALK